MNQKGLWGKRSPFTKYGSPVRLKEGGICWFSTLLRGVFLWHDCPSLINNHTVWDQFYLLQLSWIAVSPVRAKPLLYWISEHREDKYSKVVILEGTSRWNEKAHISWISKIRKVWPWLGLKVSQSKGSN